MRACRFCPGRHVGNRGNGGYLRCGGSCGAAGGSAVVAGAGFRVQLSAPESRSDRDLLLHLGGDPVADGAYSASVISPRSYMAR